MTRQQVGDGQTNPRSDSIKDGALKISKSMSIFRFYNCISFVLIFSFIHLQSSELHRLHCTLHAIESRWEFSFYKRWLQLKQNSRLPLPKESLLPRKSKIQSRWFSSWSREMRRWKSSQELFGWRQIHFSRRQNQDERSSWKTMW